jgi:L-asparaginase
MQKKNPIVVVLGTGGTMAGTAVDANDNTGYKAAQIGVAHLVAAVPALAEVPLECEQVAQVDSKDMDFGIWFALAHRVAEHLARPEVGGVVVTHGTDTLEETAYFLQRVLAPHKPVVMTAAMRPATALHMDGPQNLLDAARLAQVPGARGVLAVLGGAVYGAHDVRKVHPYRIDAFSSGDAGPIGWMEEGVLRCLRPWPDELGLGLQVLWPAERPWPRVDIVTSHAGACASTVDALCASGAQGLVVACTGNGTLHHALEVSLLQAQARGVQVVRSTRCLDGNLVGADRAQTAGDLPTSMLIPVKARIELMLRLMAAAGAAGP